ncbi:pentapeptide repeat protein [Thalassoporum mexicanum PCC 7367]|uniref:pentapeptide repeat-containing protein n=1 Tax=Thalassoporum mexicanum TaxID=3457544 RepID=UPI00029FCF32|nr:pentapeptide repeat-containing protein [Pseudanabaena sp. PCC 7367]AFY68459.1 pentapeptide repeat protein [Pseudanabaena sp. PCC 7367]
MANEEQLKILRQGVNAWNQWREKNSNIKVDLSRTNLVSIGNSFIPEYLPYSKIANLKGINLSKANLSFSIFTEVDLSGANLSQAILTNAQFDFVDLSGSNLAGAHLVETDFVGALLIGADLSRAELESTSLYGACLNGANLYEASFRHGANLISASFIKANLRKADLSQTLALNADFTRANLTGSCLQDWSINSDTKLDRVVCDYIYLGGGGVGRYGKRLFTNRLPIGRNFRPSEFTKRFQISSDIVELVFNDRIEWEAFAYSLNKIKAEHPDSQIEVSGLNNKNGLLYVNITVSPNLDKQALEAEFFKGYEFAEKKIARYYQDRLDDKEAEISYQKAWIDRLLEKASDPKVQNIITGRDFNLDADGSNVALGNMSGSISNTNENNDRSETNYDLRESQIGNLADTVKDNAQQQANQNPPEPEN